MKVSAAPAQRSKRNEAPRVRRPWPVQYDRGVVVSDVQVFPWGSFVFFKDPDGNGWALQAMTHRREQG